MIEMEQLKPASRPPPAFDRQQPTIAPAAQHAAPIPSGWANTGSSASSARAAWGSSTRPSTSRSRAGWRSRSCTRGSAPTGPRAAVPDRGPLGGEAAPHQHRAGLRLRRAGRHLLLRDAIHRRGRPGRVLEDVRRLRATADGATGPGRAGRATAQPTGRTWSGLGRRRGLLTGRFATGPATPGGSTRRRPLLLTPIGPIRPASAVAPTDRHRRPRRRRARRRFR